MKKTILISSAGRRNQLLGCFREGALRLGIELRLLTADARPELSSACHASDGAFEVPSCSDPMFVAAMLGLCEREKVDLVVPTIDPELRSLSATVSRFAELGTRVAVSSPEVVALAGDKHATVAAFAAANLRVPKTVWLDELLGDPSRLQWPVVVKPNAGSASVGLLRLSDPGELAGRRFEGALIAQECWMGREYTINLFFSSSGELRCAIPHRRLEVRAGEVSKGKTERVSGLADAARVVASVLPGARGPLCFQAIVREDGACGLFEINARFGGGYPLAHQAGARFTAWLLEELAGLPSTAADQWQENVMMLRYDDAIFTQA